MYKTLYFSSIDLACLPIRIHAVTIGIPMDACYRLVDKHIKELGLVTVNAHDIVDIVDGYIGLGYGKSSKDELGKESSVSSSNCITIIAHVALITDVVFNTGLSLDPTFTAKALLGMITEMKNHPTIFQGTRVLFIHTGTYVMLTIIILVGVMIDLCC